MTYLEAVRIHDELRPVYPRTAEQNALLNQAMAVIEASYPDEDEDDEWIVGRNGAAYSTFRI